MILRAMAYTLSFLLLLGCSHIGPQSVPRDRFDYNTAITDSWKDQTLLNIVKLRYADTQLFVEVASVVSGYTLEGSVNLEALSPLKMQFKGTFCRWVQPGNIPIVRLSHMFRSQAQNSMKAF